MTDVRVDPKLKQIVENIEHLESEKKEISTQITETYRESATLGFEPRIIKKIIGIRKKDSDTLKEEEDLVEMYKGFLGML
ncbi:MAG: DUF2312 domain-containing protein [Rickettsiales bacterium]|jgi:uncharacterized protein (UPF0335 family)|nr:DUF2312 domain-containing protein [Rickettsiales bacterium]